MDSEARVPESPGRCSSPTQLRCQAVRYTNVEPQNLQLNTANIDG
jgi:hypothetical protein